MGRIMQKRLIRKLDLEMLLSQIKPYSTPIARLEQYTIPTDVAATMLYIAAYTNNDIIDKTVLDLGCGTGRLALGAAYLGAKQVVGIDIDKSAVEMAVENAETTKLKERAQLIVGDIDAINGDFDTVLQNPPFGVQKRGADRKFLEKALETGKVVYSLHKHPERKTIPLKKAKTTRTKMESISHSPFLQEFIEKHGGRIKTMYAMTMTIPHMFSFHIKERHKFTVDLFVIEKK